MNEDKSILPDFGAQSSMFSEADNPHFNGPDYIAKLDHKRLTTQKDRIKSLMIDGTWRSLSDIREALGYPEASISAQLRHLKKGKFGGYCLEKRRSKNQEGLFEYKISV
jgi:biotin operon repressor|tara:strand:+ start:580 stop:906 length:327 start_codon:yes stop_codon:yes gene_type:complete